MDPPARNKSPLGYPGGKTRACAPLDAIVTEWFDMSRYDTIASPFMGGCSFEFFMQAKYGKRLILNDKFTPLFNFWKQVQDDGEALCQQLDAIETVSKTTFDIYKKSFDDENMDRLTQATRFFVLNRASFNSKTLSGTYSKHGSEHRYTPSSIQRIRDLRVPPSQVCIHNLDFEDFLATAVGPDADRTWIFLDPPYYLGTASSSYYGKRGDMHSGFDHRRLFDVLKTRRGWMMTYNDCAYIRELYKDDTILDVGWSYSMSRKNKKSSEIVIIRPSPP